MVVCGKGIAGFAIAFAFVLLLTTCVGMARAVCLTLNPVADTFTADYQKADDNYGTRKSLCSAKSRYAYLRFETGCFDGAYVLSAELRLYAWETQDPLEPQELYTSRNITWGEATLTWNDVLPLGELLHEFGPPAHPQWVVLPVARGVLQDAMDASSGGQCALTFALKSGGANKVKYFSREKASFAPELHIMYASAADAVTEELPVISDAFLQKNAAMRDTNAGHQKYLVSSRNRFPVMMFSGCPDIGRVYSAYLRVNAFEVTSALPEIVHWYDSTAWHELNVTYNSFYEAMKPAADRFVVKTKNVAEFTPVAGEFVSINLTDIMVDGDALKNGGTCVALTLLIEGQSVGDKNRYRSREKSIDLMPHIALDYIPRSVALNDCLAIAVHGCTTLTACNFQAEARVEDGSCVFHGSEDYLDCSDNCMHDVDSNGVCDEVQVDGSFDALPPPPNIVMIMADDLGYWTPQIYHADPAPCLTPNLLKMREDGMRFNRFYAPSPVCSPTRATFLTGRMPAKMDLFYVNDDPRPPLAHDEKTIMNVAKAHGYRTAHMGKWHLNGDKDNYPDRNHRDLSPFDVGESVMFPGGMATIRENTWTEVFVNGTEWPDQADPKFMGPTSTFLTDFGIDFIERAVAANEPFYINFWFSEPHLEVEALAKYRDLYPDLSNFYQRYYGCISQMDYNIGRIRDSLEALGVAGNTMVWFTSDNGPIKEEQGNGPLRGGKRMFFEGGVRVPGLVVWPDVVQAGASSEEVAGIVDFYPTIVKAIRGTNPSANSVVEKPKLYHAKDGTNLLPLLNATYWARLEGEPNTPFKRRSRYMMWDYGTYDAAVLDTCDGCYKLVAYTNSKAGREGPIYPELYKGGDEPRFKLYNICKDVGESSVIKVQTQKMREAKARKALRGAFYKLRCSWVDEQMLLDGEMMVEWHEQFC